MSSPSLVTADGDLLPIWGFLTFHQALRRDARRFPIAARALAGGQLDAAAVPALRAHWERYRALLEFHHQAEDDQLFPTARDAEPALGTVLDLLGAQHDELHATLAHLTDLARSIGRSSGAEAAAEAFDQLRASLDLHLDAEEEHVVPVMLRILAVRGSDGPAPAAQELPVPVEFAHPWSTEHLDDDLVGLALATLSVEEQVRYPDWLADYHADLALWCPDGD